MTSSALQTSAILASLGQAAFVWDVTSDTGVWACGLTGLYGPLDQNNFDDGVWLSAPAHGDAGLWTMTVSANNYGETTCLQ